MINKFSGNDHHENDPVIKAKGTLLTQIRTMWMPEDPKDAFALSRAEVRHFSLRLSENPAEERKGKVEAKLETRDLRNLPNTFLHMTSIPPHLLGPGEMHTKADWERLVADVVAVRLGELREKINQVRAYDKSLYADFMRRRKAIMTLLSTEE